jgi:hypothetical protein
MQDDLITLFNELKTRIAVVWPEVATMGSTENGDAHGIHKMESVQNFPFEMLAPPYAVVELPLFREVSMGMGNHVLEGFVPIYYVKDITQDSLTDMSVKLKQLQRYLNDVANDLPDELGQIVRVSEVGYSPRLALNRAFIERSLPNRGGAVIARVWLNELADD